MAGYISKTPDARGLYPYTAEEDAVWGELFTRQMRFLEGRMAPAFLEAVHRLGLTAVRSSRLPRRTSTTLPRSSHCTVPWRSRSGCTT